MENIKEEWKDIPDYEGLYQVSTLGNVKSLNYRHTGKERLLKPTKEKLGYCVVGLYKNNKRKIFTVHKLVALAFLKNPYNLPQVNHKNEIKTDNRVENLEWVTPKENCNYGTRNERVSEKMKGKMKGENNPMYGKHLSEEHKQKLSKAMSGKPKSEEHKQKLSKANSIPIIQLDLQKNFIREWESATQVSQELNLKQGNITSVCKGKRKTSGGYIWRYKE